MFDRAALHLSVEEWSLVYGIGVSWRVAGPNFGILMQREYYKVQRKTPMDHHTDGWMDG